MHGCGLQVETEPLRSSVVVFDRLLRVTSERNHNLCDCIKVNATGLYGLLLEGIVEGWLKWSLDAIVPKYALSALSETEVDIVRKLKHTLVSLNRSCIRFARR